MSAVKNKPKDENPTRKLKDNNASDITSTLLGGLSNSQKKDNIRSDVTHANPGGITNSLSFGNSDHKYGVQGGMGVPSNITYTGPGGIPNQTLTDMSGMTYTVPGMASNIGYPQYPVPGQIPGSQINPMSGQTYIVSGGMPSNHNVPGGIPSNISYTVPGGMSGQQSNFNHTFFPSTPGKGLLDNEIKPPNFGTPTLKNPILSNINQNLNFNENIMCDGKQHFRNAVNDLVNNNHQVLSQNIRHEELIDKVYSLKQELSIKNSELQRKNLELDNLSMKMHIEIQRESQIKDQQRAQIVYELQNAGDQIDNTLSQYKSDLEFERKQNNELVQKSKEYQEMIINNEQSYKETLNELEKKYVTKSDEDKRKWEEKIRLLLKNKLTEKEEDFQRKIEDQHISHAQKNVNYENLIADYSFKLNDRFNILSHKDTEIMDLKQQLYEKDSQYMLDIANEKKKILESVSKHYQKKLDVKNYETKDILDKTDYSHKLTLDQLATKMRRDLHNQRSNSKQRLEVEHEMVNRNIELREHKQIIDDHISIIKKQEIDLNLVSVEWEARYNVLEEQYQNLMKEKRLVEEYSKKDMETMKDACATKITKIMNESNHLKEQFKITNGDQVKITAHQLEMLKTDYMNKIEQMSQTIKDLESNKVEIQQKNVELQKQHKDRIINNNLENIQNLETKCTQIKSTLEDEHGYIMKNKDEIISHLQKEIEHIKQKNEDAYDLQTRGWKNEIEMTKHQFEAELQLEKQNYEQLKQELFLDKDRETTMLLNDLRQELNVNKESEVGTLLNKCHNLQNELERERKRCNEFYQKESNYITIIDECKNKFQSDSGDLSAEIIYLQNLNEKLCKELEEYKQLNSTNNECYSSLKIEYEKLNREYQNTTMIHDKSRWEKNFSTQKKDDIIIMVSTENERLKKQIDKLQSEWDNESKQEAENSFLKSELNQVKLELEKTRQDMQLHLIQYNENDLNYCKKIENFQKEISSYQQDLFSKNEAYNDLDLLSRRKIESQQMELDNLNHHLKISRIQTADSKLLNSELKTLKQDIAAAISCNLDKYPMSIKDFNVERRENNLTKSRDFKSPYDVNSPKKSQVFSHSRESMQQNKDLSQKIFSSNNNTITPERLERRKNFNGRLDLRNLICRGSLDTNDFNSASYRNHDQTSNNYDSVYNIHNANTLSLEKGELPRIDENEEAFNGVMSIYGDHINSKLYELNRDNNDLNARYSLGNKETNLTDHATA